MDRRAPMIVLLSLPVLLAPLAASASWVDSPRSLVILRHDAPGTMQEFMKTLEAAGGHAAVAVPPRTAWVYADPEVLTGREMQAWIEGAHRDRIDPVAVAAGDANVARMARVWNRSLEMRAALLDAPAHSHDQPHFPDAGPIPVELPPAPRSFRDAPTHIPYGAEYYDTSTYLAGSIAVGVWLLEAAGSTYDWSQAEEDETLAGVMNGFDYWVANHGGTMAFLSFVADIHTDVPVSGVPIENPQGWDSIWIDEVLTNEGWSGANAFEKCFAYNNSIRDTFQTNWTYSLFMVDSDPAVNQGLFQGGGYAWAYYGGPWIWMSRYSTWAYNAANYHQAVPMHEMGHIFFATDEYDGFEQWSGYLNFHDTASTSVLCMMNQNAYPFLCTPTMKQLAWRDNDSDDIMEPLDQFPDATPDELLPDPTTDFTPTWTGTAVVNTRNNVNPNSPYNPPHHDITLVTITAVECRVDGGAWSAATATDGTFDGYVEDFSWTSPPLTNGIHVVEARSQSSVGNWTTAFGADTLEVQGSAVGVETVAADAGVFVLHPAQPNPARDDTIVRFSLPRSASVRLAIYATDGTLVRTLHDGAHAAGPGNVRWDGRNESGAVVPAGVYFYRMETGGFLQTRKLTLLR